MKRRHVVAWKRKKIQGIWGIDFVIAEFIYRWFVVLEFIETGAKVSEELYCRQMAKEV